MKTIKDSKSLLFKGFKKARDAGDETNLRCTKLTAKVHQIASHSDMTFEFATQKYDKRGRGGPMLKIWDSILGYLHIRPLDKYTA